MTFPEDLDATAEPITLPASECVNLRLPCYDLTVHAYGVPPSTSRYDAIMTPLALPTAGTVWK